MSRSNRWIDFDFDDDDHGLFGREMGAAKKQGHSPLSKATSGQNLVKSKNGCNIVSNENFSTPLMPHDNSISHSSRSSLVKPHNSNIKIADSAISNSKVNVTLGKDKVHHHGYKAPNSILKQRKPPIEQQKYSKTVQNVDEIPITRRLESTRDRVDNERVGPEDILRGYLPRSRQKKQSWAVPENTNGKRKMGETNRLQSSPSSSSIDSSNSNHRSDVPYRGRPKRRKAIPGPVGVFKASLNKSAKKALRSKEMVVSRIAATQDSIFDSSSSDKIIDEYSDFRQGPWLNSATDLWCAHPWPEPATYLQKQLLWQCTKVYRFCNNKRIKSVFKRKSGIYCRNYRDFQRKL